jgi:flavin reductase (DIM6/NTAB) family NADH-FMN oxidoreductase RutF
VTIVTALGRHRARLGITVNSFASVSLDPPLVLWSQDRQTPSHLDYLTADRMVINVLSEDQRELAARFSRPHPDKFAEVAWDAAACGTPILRGCAATFVCHVADRYDGGDHTIHLCRVESCERSDRAPLIFCQGAYL